MQLEALFKQPQALPTVPKIVHELIDSFNQEDVAVDAIARKIAADPVLSARLLRLANSAYYHVSRTVGTVDDALLMLGFVTVRTLVISSGLTGGFKAVPGMDLERFWRHSLNTAVTSRWLAKATGQNADLAFTVGLMHGLGELVMHSGMPEEVLELNKQVSPLDARRLSMEQQTFGYHYAAVGAELAKQWKFPAAFVDAIKRFPDPLTATPADKTAAIIHIAVWRARAELSGAKQEELTATVPAAVCESLGLSPQQVLHDMPPLKELSEGLEALLG